MAVLNADQAAAIAGQIKSTGFQVQNFGGGSGETYHYNQNVMSTQATNPSTNLLGKIASIGKTALDLTGKAGGGLYHFARDDIAKPLGRLTKDVTYTPVNIAYHGVRDWQISNNIDHLNTQRQAATKAYQSGKMSKQDYNETISSISTTLQGYNRDLASSQRAFSQTQADYHHLPSDVANTAMTALAVFTGGGSEAGSLAARIAGVGGKDLLTASIEKSGAEKVTQLAGSRGVKAFAANGGKADLKELIQQSSNKLEQAVMKVPGVSGAIERSLTRTLQREAQQQLIGETTAQFVRREGKTLATALLIKDPIVYHLNIDSGDQIYHEMATGKYGQAAVDTALQSLQLFEGPVTAIKNVLKNTGSKLRDLTYGQGSYIDELSKNIGDGAPDSIANFVKSGEKVTSRTGKTEMSGEEIYRYAQENNLRRAAEDPKVAVSNTIENYLRAGIDPATITPRKIAVDLLNHQEAVNLAKQLGARGVKGLTKEQAQNLVVVRFDSITKRSIANAIREAGDDKQAMTAAIENFSHTSGAGWVNNPTLMAELTHIVDEAPSAEAAAKRIQSIPTALATPKNVPARLAKQLGDLGYSVAVPEGGKRESSYINDYNDTRKLVSSVTDGSEEGAKLFDPAVAPQPQLNAAAGFLTKIGLSPIEANVQAYQALSTSVANHLDQVGAAEGLGFKGAGGNNVLGGQVILSKLQDWVQNVEHSRALSVVTGTFGKARPAITDIRQMTTKNIKDALNMGNHGVKITEAQAKEISKAIVKGYTDVPLELRGLGDKVVDYLYKANPAHKYYSRLQSALRYSYNPFFQAQEAFETSFFTGAQGGNKITATIDNGLKWGKTKAELDGTIKTLEDARIFSSSLGGEAAQDQVLGRISADITTGQKRDLAGLAQDIAKSQGTTVEDLVQNNPSQIEDALRIIVQYPKKGGLATPLARTLNYAFFPMRYNLKVTKLAAEILSKQPPAVQFATIHSLLNLKSWLQSDEGIRWRAQNADAIQVFNWISPLNNISSLFNTLGYVGDLATGKPNAGPGALGQLGGLPFGVISQILDSEGIININKPYVQPKTGDVIPNYIPNTTKARAATALQDLLGSVFTYPGQTLGLPGKTATIRNLVSKFADTKGQYTIQQYTTKDAQGHVTINARGMAELSKGQQNLIRVLAGDTSQDALDSLYMDENGMATLPPTVLPFHVPEELPTLTKTQLLQAKASKKSSSSKTKVYAKPMGTQ